MSAIQLVLIALGVAADAFAVSLAQGTWIKRNLVRRAFVLAAAFGVAQAVMPAIGWFIGNSVLGFIKDIDHWVAFGLLVAVGVHMIVESLPGDGDNAAAEHVDNFSLRAVFLLAIATSIDALAVGFGFAATDGNILLAALIIGLMTAGFSLLGVWLGHRGGKRFGRPATVVGGLVLIGIGTSILIEHLTA